MLLTCRGTPNSELVELRCTVKDVYHALNKYMLLTNLNLFPDRGNITEFAMDKSNYASNEVSFLIVPGGSL